MSEKETLEDIQKRVRRIEIRSNIQTAIVLLGFLGILTLPDLLKKIK